MITVTRILGAAVEPEMADRLHHVSHHGGIEILTIDRADTLRRRLRARTDKGTEVAIALPREEQLRDGAVLLCEHDRAIVVRMSQERWLRVSPRDADSALEAGYTIGNLHWRVRYEPGAILVALEGPREHYESRLEHLAKDGRIEVGGDG